MQHLKDFFFPGTQRTNLRRASIAGAVDFVSGKCADDEAETEPLMRKMAVDETYSAGYSFDAESGQVKCIDENPTLIAQGITDTMSYSTSVFTTWSAFRISYSTVWTNPELWLMLLRLSVVSLVVGVATFLIVPDPAVLKVSKFTAVSKFLNVIVGLLLGFFLSSSMNRWHHCVDGFLELLDSIRNIQMQFAALGVPQEQTILCLRWGFSSAWLLYGQLLVETKRGEEQVAEREAMWSKMAEKAALIDKSGETKLLTEAEISVLKLTRDPPGMMWMWAGALIGRLANDGWIPPMPSPTYGRVMQLAQNAHGSIRQVRAAISIQAPLTYCHMLATLVHINNLLNAATFGVVSGVAIATTMLANGIHIPFHADSIDARGKDSDHDLQSVAVTFMYCFFGPLLYQALLMIGMQLAQPFDSDDAKIPMHRLLHQLEVDMCNGRDLLNHMPFPRPAFKSPAPAPPPSTEAAGTSSKP